LLQAQEQSELKNVILFNPFSTRVKFDLSPPSSSFLGEQAHPKILSFVSCQSWSFGVQAHHLWCFPSIFCVVEGGTRAPRKRCSTTMMGIIFFQINKLTIQPLIIFYCHACLMFMVVSIQTHHLFGAPLVPLFCVVERRA
jgi:hypothetical protein